jgi:hypothetical protein
MSSGVVQLAEQQLREQAPSAPHLQPHTSPCVETRILASQAAKTYSLLFDDPLPICTSQAQWVEWAEQRECLLDKWHCLPALRTSARCQPQTRSCPPHGVVPLRAPLAWARERSLPYQLPRDTGRS